jgi:hypothetical protein
MTDKTREDMAQRVLGISNHPEAARASGSLEGLRVAGGCDGAAGVAPRARGTALGSPVKPSNRRWSWPPVPMAKTELAVVSTETVVVTATSAAQAAVVVPLGAVVPVLRALTHRGDRGIMWG